MEKGRQLTKIVQSRKYNLAEGSLRFFLPQFTKSSPGTQRFDPVLFPCFNHCVLRVSIGSLRFSFVYRKAY
jgi:hypothetical protein